MSGKKTERAGYGSKLGPEVRVGLCRPLTERESADLADAIWQSYKLRRGKQDHNYDRPRTTS